jgi:hypothetical protein
MFEKIAKSAEKVAGKVGVSRRGFLGTGAKLAAGVGATLAGLLAFPSQASAGHGKCYYLCEDGQIVSVPLHGVGCPYGIGHSGRACWFVRYEP